MAKTIGDIKRKKTDGEKITMLTAYDYPTAVTLDEAGIDIVLVGDSLAHVVLGLDSTKDVGMAEMLHHAKAVRRGVKQALLVGDMPWEAYQKDASQSVKNARRFIDEAGCEAVKLEWFDQCLDVTKEIVDAGIPVMGHVGLTPQRADELGGYKVQGKTTEDALNIIEQAKALEKVGCFSIVLECIPRELAKVVTGELSIPTIGIGAGVHCDGQVLVTNDVLGVRSQHTPKFVKRFAQYSEALKEAIGNYKKEVQAGTFPDDAHSYSIPSEHSSRLNN